MDYKVKNWESYQHYKDRNPPWIKLHYDILTSRDWVKFSDASKLLAIVCMMLASRNNGILEGDLEYIKSVAHLSKLPDLKPLIKSGFLIPLADASTMQADAIIEEIIEDIKEDINTDRKKPVFLLDFLKSEFEKLENKEDGLTIDNFIPDEWYNYAKKYFNSDDEILKRFDKFKNYYILKVDNAKKPKHKNWLQSWQGCVRDWN